MIFYLSLAAGLVLLLVTGDALVRGAVALSVRFKIPTIIIGLTVVAFGTSAPELVVSLNAAVSGVPGLAIGNVVGSNIANILLVLGVPSLIAATDCNQPLIRRNLFYMLGGTLVFISLCFAGPLTVWHGLILVTLLIAFLYESASRAKGNHDLEAILGEEAIETIDGVKGLPMRPLMITFLILVGLIGLPLGAHLTVYGATGIARAFGVSETVIGLTIVALGTSLPELAATVMGAIRGQAGLALGNVLGSNLFNLLAIMGLTALVAPVPVADQLKQIDLWVMLGTGLLLLPFVLPRIHITRLPALLFVLGYLGYIYYTFMPHAAHSLAATGPVIAG